MTTRIIAFFGARFLKSGPLQVLYNLGVLAIYAEFAAKHLWQSLFLIVTNFSMKLFKKRLRPRYFLVHFNKYLRNIYGECLRALLSKFHFRFILA